MANSNYVIKQTDNGIRLQGQNLEFFKYKGAESICAGPADTGKTFALCLKMHLCACKYPGASIAMVRRTQTSCYNTIIRTFTEKILGPDPTAWPCIPYGGMNRPERFNYENGSIIFVSGLDKPSRLLSSEFDLVAVSQTEEISLSAWEMLTTRATGRHGVMPYALVCGDANPGPPQHWILHRKRAGKLVLFDSTHKDNPELWDGKTWTKKGAARRERLRNLTGSRYSRLFLGLWSAPEGMIYEHFDEAFHKIKSVELPAFWPRVVGIDPVGAQIAAVWLAYDPHNQVIHVYREYMQPFGETTPQHVRHVENMSKGEMIMAWVGGGPSERQQRMDWGGILEPGITDVWSGIDRINSLLREKGLFIHDCCVNLLSEIGQYQRVIGKDGIATDKILDKEKFHCLDSLRYAIAWLSRPQEQIGTVQIPLVPIGAEF